MFKQRTGASLHINVSIKFIPLYTLGEATSQQSVYTISMLWGNTAYCVILSGEDLSRYSNKIPSAGLKKMSVLSLFYSEGAVAITDIWQSLPHIMAEKQLA